METTEEILFLPSTYHYSSHDRTPSPSSSSQSNTDNESNSMDPFSNLLTYNADFQTDLEMDLFGDDPNLTVDIEREEQRLREDLMSFGTTADIHGFLEIKEDNGDTNALISPFEIDFNSEGSPLLSHNENSTSSSSSVDGSLSTHNIFQYPDPHSPSMDSPPLTPPEIKVDVSSPQHEFLFGAATNPATNILPNNLTQFLPTLKSSKRGRSASNDDTPDVQALKRHIRMIRNRESASLSRKKKKDYVTGLETRIQDLEKENDSLKKENGFLRSKLQQLGQKTTGQAPPGSFSRLEKKARVGVMAKVALLGLFGFVMINFHTTTRPLHPLEHSNLSEFSRTLTKLKLSEDHSVVDRIPLILTSQRRFIPSDDETNSINITSSFKSAQGNISMKANTHNSSRSSINSVHSNITTPISYLNGTAYNQTHHIPVNITVNVTLPQKQFALNATDMAYGSKIKNRTYSGLKSDSSRWRSRGINKKHSNWTRSSSSLKSATWVFPPFMGSVGVTNSTDSGINPKDGGQHQRCPNSFNKTESLRVKNDLEDIFGRRKKNLKLSPLRAEPIVYSLVSQSSNDVMPLNSLDFNKGLTLYEGEKKKYSNILEKMERREDTFYVVSLASENQLLLSAKASNESSRPKMTLLLPWRNETLKEDMILQIDCEVFQVFNLNEKNQPKAQKRASSGRA